MVAYLILLFTGLGTSLSFCMIGGFHYQVLSHDIIILKSISSLIKLSSCCLVPVLCLDTTQLTYPDPILFWHMLKLLLTQNIHSFTLTPHKATIDKSLIEMQLRLFGCTGLLFLHHTV